MNMENTVKTILIAVMVIAGYVVAASAACRRAQKRQHIPIIAVAVMFMYLCVVGFIAVLYIFFGNNEFVLYIALCVFVVCELVFVVVTLIKNRQDTNFWFLLMFILVCAAIAYATILSRTEAKDHTLRMELFAGMREIMDTGSTRFLKHNILNVCLFMPAGILIPLINRKVCSHMIYALLFGMVASTAIETIQYFTYLGMFDINDIIANTAGTVLGYSITAICTRIRKNWAV